MIPSVILGTVARILFAATLLVSLWVLLRGHNVPGGGFIGGLLATCAFTLYAFARGAAEARLALRLPPAVIAGAGVALAGLSMIPAILVGLPAMTGLWWLPDLGIDEKVALGTPLIFDIGVYLAVAGAVLAIIFELWED